MRELSYCLAILLMTGAAAAQQSTSFRLEQHVFNAAGHPADGALLTSTSFRISLDSLGDGLSSRALTGPSFGVDGGFAVAFRPPGEVTGLRLTDKTTLRWDVEPAAVSYNLYRDSLGRLSSLGFGDCQQQEIGDIQTVDPALPPAGEGFFYLVTARNGLREEGPKGWQSDGTPRGGSVCP